MSMRLRDDYQQLFISVAAWDRATIEGSRADPSSQAGLSGLASRVRLSPVDTGINFACSGPEGWTYSTGQSEINRGQSAGSIGMVLVLCLSSTYSRALRDSLARPRVPLLGVRGGLVPFNEQRVQRVNHALCWASWPSAKETLLVLPLQRKGSDNGTRE